MELKTYSEVLIEYGNENIPYDILLLTIDWKQFRDKIVSSDNFQCNRCNKKQTQYAWENKNAAPLPVHVFLNADGRAEYTLESTRLNVHHRFYIKNSLPWEYEKNSLETVCTDCHIKIHETENIQVYSDFSRSQIEDVEKCLKCSGIGYIEKYRLHYHGICFDCRGNGYINTTANTG